MPAIPGQLTNGKAHEGDGPEKIVSRERILKSPKKLTLLQLLTKSESVDPSAPCHPDFLDYRQKNLQWRTGSAEGTKGEVTDVETPKLRAAIASQCSGFQRCSSWPIFPLPSPERKTWMLSTDLESELQASYPQVWARLMTQAGCLLQIVVLFLVVCTYAACPLTVSWAKVVGSDAGVPIKGRPFKESSVIVVSWWMIAVVGLLLSAATGGRRAVRQCVDRRAILLFAPAGIGWALADVCEVLAVARIDPATYGVISQARLLGSAAACWLIRGMRQTKLQWGVLAALSLVCMAYTLVPDDPVHNKVRLFRWRVSQAELKFDWRIRRPQQLETSGDDGGAMEHAIGVVLALLKVTLSVLSGVYGESCFKVVGPDGKPPELHVQMTQISFSSMVAAAMGYCSICYYQGENIHEFFSGPDGDWDFRTLMVAVMYCWREWICNLCVKRFDSLVKNICNAVALVVTYVFTVVSSCEIPFSPLKVLLLLAVVAEVVNYSATRRLSVQQESPVTDKGGNGNSHNQTNGHIQNQAAPDLPVAEYAALRNGNHRIELKEL
mmetsp:Transcript_130609/g.325908  ORF Transcript_130609/g.325908 Transcript_130609/m.325908 type:complete len:551 (+) Transcript_130609:116-1768(+)|eukprot:CAMPEP_0115225266 /NCGR_PEP_ID=MMETSP0270-20121206/30013_1 /TAXON_ID=71861 /ORGANISM="Scrippsiella trochoidea, Strain CCMP3099" /LENGTH=550 /DNA_ID=CAMNT_0002639625 /DNA_START=116 /DNA_END=1768 /DNA_ORIENTATION=-